MMAVLVCKGYHNKIPRTGWLEQHSLIYLLTAPEANSPGSGSGLVSGEASLPRCGWL